LNRGRYQTGNSGNWLSAVLTAMGHDVIKISLVRKYDDIFSTEPTQPVLLSSVERSSIFIKRCEVVGIVASRNPVNRRGVLIKGVHGLAPNSQGFRWETGIDGWSSGSRSHIPRG
jgi:hypothetical protein